MKKRILAALISGIMVVTGISACSGGANSSVDSNNQGRNHDHCHNQG